MNRAEHAREVKNALTSPQKLCEALGIADGSKRQSTGLLVCCPVHGEKDASCSVTIGPDGTIRVRCFACDFGGDALHLIAACHGLDLRSDFKQVLAAGADIAGHLQLRDEILGGERLPERKPVQAPAPRPEVDYPPQAEVDALWEACKPVTSDDECRAHLLSRGIQPGPVFVYNLARVIPRDASLPHWARYRGRTWTQTGHRLLVRMFDASGAARSVRAWRIVDGDSPKRLPPGGCRASDLVMVNQAAWLMLRRRWCPTRLVIAEGEPDWLTSAVAWSDNASIGIVSGSWNEEFARTVPRGTEVVVNTHNDEAGDRYAEQILSTLRSNPSWRMAS